jgi:hypothetical protein
MAKFPHSNSVGNVWQYALVAGRRNQIPLYGVSPHHIPHTPLPHSCFRNAAQTCYQRLKYPKNEPNAIPRPVTL